MYIKKKYRELLSKADKQFTIPPSFQKFIEKQKMAHNLIIKSKGNNCRCTFCHNKFVAQTKVNREIRCPNCKQKLLVKTDRLQQYNFKDNLQLLDKVDNVLVLRTFELYTSYNKDKMESHITEFMRTIIENDEIHDFTSNQVLNHMGYMYVAHYVPFIYWKARSRWAYRDVRAIVAPCNIRRLLKNTNLKYSMLDKYVTKMDYIDLVRCMKLASYPSFEMLVKMKLYNLVSEADKFTTGKNFQEIFGLSKTYYQFMKKHNINYKQLQVLKILQKEDIKLINKLVNYNNLEDLSKYVNLEDAYYKVLKRNHHREHEYLDYLLMCLKLQYSLKDKKILFPKNLMQEHDRLVNLVEIVKNEANDRLIKERLEELNKNVYQNRKYIIFPAPSVASLLDESRQMSNCVKSYCSRYALGETDIYFLRMIEHQDRSLVTVEINNNEIVQARTKYNEPINKSQENFLDKWKKTVLDKGALSNA